MRTRVPKDLKREHVLAAIADLDAGIAHPFFPAKGYYLLHGRRRYPPKAVVGLAVKHFNGQVLKPKDFSAGNAPGQANDILRRLDFTVKPKKTFDQTDTYITSRSFKLPTDPEKLEKSLWFNMWQKRLQPYATLQKGDVVYWYDRFEKALVWKSRVTHVSRLTYSNKANLKKQFSDLFGVHELTDVYFDKAVKSGYCLAYTVRPLKPVRMPKPEGRRFPLSGWLNGNSQLAREWLGDTGSSDKRPALQNTRKKVIIRRPSSFEEYKRAYQYLLNSSDRTIVPAHYNYQVNLKKMLTRHGIDCEFEGGFVDVAFKFQRLKFIGEIKVTTTLPLAHAFRFALGQLLEYAHMKYERKPHMIMFLDQPLDAKRLDLATKHRISVVVQDENRYWLMNPYVMPILEAIFPN